MCRPMYPLLFEGMRVISEYTLMWSVNNVHVKFTEKSA